MSRASIVARDNIKQELWTKQLQLEKLINPSAVSDSIEHGDQP